MNHSILSISLLAFSGLVLFLYAVSRLALTLRQVAGERMRGVLNRFTKTDRKSTRLNSSHRNTSRMPSSA